MGKRKQPAQKDAAIMRVKNLIHYCDFSIDRLKERCFHIPWRMRGQRLWILIPKAEKGSWGSPDPADLTTIENTLSQPLSAGELGTLHGLYGKQLSQFTLKESRVAAQQSFFQNRTNFNFIREDVFFNALETKIHSAIQALINADHIEFRDELPVRLLRPTPGLIAYDTSGPCTQLSVMREKFQKWMKGKTQARIQKKRRSVSKAFLRRVLDVLEKYPQGFKTWRELAIKLCLSVDGKKGLSTKSRLSQVKSELTRRGYKFQEPRYCLIIPAQNPPQK